MTIQIGRLGIFAFPAGLYVYTGSAKRGLQNRLARHLSKEKKLRWHIDYMLHAPEVSIVHIKKFIEPECDINSKTKGDIVIPGFGSSDCRQCCGSHLKKLSNPLANHIDF